MNIEVGDVFHTDLDSRGRVHVEVLNIRMKEKGTFIHVRPIDPPSTKEAEILEPLFREHFHLTKTA